jgi:cation diffusion facilitator CzcD-associated flavoprotein CzcO
MAGKTVGIVGAGPSGIAVAKCLIEDGFNVTLFDREKQIGGIWSPDGAYIDLQTQLVAGFMEYSDLPDTEGFFFFKIFLNIHI